MMFKIPEAGAAGAVLLLAGVLSGCSEPKQPESSAAPAATTASADGVQAAPGVAPVELNIDERRVPLSAAKACNLERADGVLFSAQPIEVSKATTSTMRLTGWLANVEQRTVPGLAELRLTSTDKRVWRVAIETGGKRDDVMALLGGDAAFANPGFSATVNIGSLPVNSYRVYLVFAEGEAFRSCDNGRAIVIKD